MSGSLGASSQLLPIRGSHKWETAANRSRGPTARKVFSWAWTVSVGIRARMRNPQREERGKRAGRDVVFISHAYADMELALILKKALEGAFPSATIFDSSDPSSTQPREEWVRKVLEHLQRSALVVVIATERSMRRYWVWFEAGAAWEPMPNFVTCCIGAMHKGNLPAPFSSYTALSLTDARELELLFEEIAKHFERPLKLPAFDELRTRLGEIEESILRDQRALEDPFSEKRWELVKATLDRSDETDREAFQLLLLYGNATDYFALGELKRRGLAQNYAGVFEGLLNKTNLIQNVSGQSMPPRAQPEYSLQWEIKSEFRPFVRRYFVELKSK